jgi:hypothetical protein
VCRRSQTGIGPCNRDATPPRVVTTVVNSQPVAETPPTDHTKECR